MELGGEVADLGDALGALAGGGGGGALEAAEGVGEVDGHREKVPRGGLPGGGGRSRLRIPPERHGGGHCPLV